MSKNLTRKGLVLGTVAALGASLFAGTPATAAPTALYLDTAFGTSGASQTGVLGQWFTLASSNLGGTSSDTVKYYLEGATAANVSFVGRYTTDLSASGSTAYSASAAATAVDNDAKTAVISGGTLTAGNYYELAVKLNSTNITSTTSLKVTPFLDNVIADNKPGANELTGTAVTINFVKGSELTATPTLSVVTGGKATATVAVSGGVNLAQFRTTAKGGQGTTPFTVDFKETGADWSGNTAQDVFWNTTDSVLSVASASNTTAGNVYGATAKIGGTASASATAVTANFLSF